MGCRSYFQKGFRMNVLASVAIATMMAASATPALAGSLPNGPFRPVGPQAKPAAVRSATGPASASAFPIITGTVSVTLSVQILSSISTSIPITCAATVQAYTSFASKAVPATRTSSSAATCSVVLPYTLNADPTYPLFSADFYVYYGQIGNDLGPSGSGAAGEVNSEFVSASSYPANGTTTSYSGTVRL